LLVRLSNIFSTLQRSPFQPDKLNPNKNEPVRDHADWLRLPL